MSSKKGKKEVKSLSEIPESHLRNIKILGLGLGLGLAKTAVLAGLRSKYAQNIFAESKQHDLDMQNNEELLSVEEILDSIPTYKKKTIDRSPDPEELINSVRLTIKAINKGINEDEAEEKKILKESTKKNYEDYELAKLDHMYKNKLDQFNGVVNSEKTDAYRNIEVLEADAQEASKLVSEKTRQYKQVTHDLVDIRAGIHKLRVGHTFMRYDEKTVVNFLDILQAQNQNLLSESGAIKEYIAGVTKEIDGCKARIAEADKYAKYQFTHGLHLTKPEITRMQKFENLRNVLEEQYRLCNIHRESNSENVQALVLENPQYIVLEKKGSQGEVLDTIDFGLPHSEEAQVEIPMDEIPNLRPHPVGSTPRSFHEPKDFGPAGKKFEKLVEDSKKFVNIVVKDYIAGKRPDLNPDAIGCDSDGVCKSAPYIFPTTFGPADNSGDRWAHWVIHNDLNNAKNVERNALAALKRAKIDFEPFMPYQYTEDELFNLKQEADAIEEKLTQLRKEKSDLVQIDLPAVQQALAKKRLVIDSLTTYLNDLLTIQKLDADGALDYSESRDMQAKDRRFKLIQQSSEARGEGQWADRDRSVQWTSKDKVASASYNVDKVKNQIAAAKIKWDVKHGVPARNQHRSAYAQLHLQLEEAMGELSEAKDAHAQVLNAEAFAKELEKTSKKSTEQFTETLANFDVLDVCC